MHLPTVNSTFQYPPIQYIVPSTNPATTSTYPVLVIPYAIPTYPEFNSYYSIHEQQPTYYRSHMHRSSIHLLRTQKDLRFNSRTTTTHLLSHMLQSNTHIPRTQKRLLINSRTTTTHLLSHMHQSSIHLPRTQKHLLFNTRTTKTHLLSHKHQSNIHLAITH
jgi:hypothetical protein